MLVDIGAALTIVLLVFTMFAAWHRRIGGGGIAAFGIVSIVAGATVANLPRIASFAVHAGENKSLDVKWQEVQTAAQQVQTDTTEVRQMKEQIETLVKRVEQGEQNVSQMHDAMQQTWRALFESSAYTIMTRNIFPIPAPVAQEVDRAVNNLAAFAYPDPQERSVAFQTVKEKVKQAQGQ